MAGVIPSRDDPWLPALVGGVGSIPLTALYVHSGTDAAISMNVLLVGGFVAGYLAERRSERVGRASALAGLLGGFPFYVLALDTLLAFQWSYPSPWWAVAGFAWILLGVGVIVGVSIVGGFIGGAFGSRIAKHLRRSRDGPAAS